MSRAAAREAYRNEQHNPELQMEWKQQVSAYKTASESLKRHREAFYRCALHP